MNVSNSVYRWPCAALFVLLLALGGCSRQSDTHDTGSATDTSTMNDTGAANDTTSPDTSTPDANAPDANAPDANMSDSSGQAAMAPTTDTEICTPEWFAWVHDQVMAMPDGKRAELYPNGLPEVGSDEWFIAIDKLTGGDGAHGPDGGSAEWCSMMQERLAKPDNGKSDMEQPDSGQ
ncbi:hypothetical protein [Microbulbifer sp. SAOS-129_SWC]|uniref:hypothetical protein n=1 Tax=Microbulbifer sp. SAOS-129_SWC TaxID=3145235 RepID=UPI003217C275